LKLQETTQSESVQVFYCLFIHSRRKSNYQEWVWSNKSVLTWPHFCVCPKLGSVFPTPYGVDFAFNL
jgi:hypothetical protein